MTNSAGPHAYAADVEKVRSATQMFFNHEVQSFAWRKITVTVRDRTTKQTRQLLEDVTGYALPGEMVALMGPSGSGKTTLLNYLAGRRVTGSSSSSSGQVLINGAEQKSSYSRKIGSYVEQEDTLLGSLTTQETLEFAAELAEPRTNRSQIQERATSLVDAFGLSSSRNTLIGIPIQKGLSGGQKRRVSVASQLITGPRILFLDKPTSGLDSTASLEIMGYLKAVAKESNIIVIASIHQPSTKTFELFDRVSLLSQGACCFFGSAKELSPYFKAMGRPFPLMMNPAEYILDAVNVDFGKSDNQRTIGSNIESVKAYWQDSEQRSSVAKYADSIQSSEPVVRFHQSPGHELIDFLRIILTLIHRSLLKSTRDLVVYWVRIAMYTGLAVMMGTVWLRLPSTQESIQPFANALFFGSAFISFMAVAYVPAYLEDRSVFVRDRANGLYGAVAFNITNFLVGLPYLFGIAIIFSIISYWLISFEPSINAFFRYVMWLYLDLLAAESLVVLFASIFPNFVIALALVAFANGLWMSVGGFLVPPTILNVFWKYVFHYIDYQAYVFQGMMVNEFQDRVFDCDASCHCAYMSELAPQCQIAGEAVLQSYGYATGRTGKWVGILLAIAVVYRLLALLAMMIRKT